MFCFLQLGLANNPLECDCELRWLYERLQPHNQTLQYATIRWRCADLNKWFNRLADTDFTNCTSVVSGHMTSKCEDLIPTTTPAVIYPSDPRLELAIAEGTQTSVTVQWSVSSELDVVKQVVTRRQLDSGSNVEVRLQLAAAQRRYVLTGLQPNSTYKVCVELTAGNGTSVVSCRPVMTSFGGGSSSKWASIELIIAIAVGSGLAAVVVVSVAVYCCCAAHRRRQLPISSSGGPRPSAHTKRFRKPGSAATSPAGEGRSSSQYSATQDEVDRAIVESVDRLDRQSIEVLANLLRSASAGSLDHIGGPSYYPSPPNTGGDALAGAHGRPTSRNFYEMLPDDTYDQIPTDEYV